MSFCYEFAVSLFCAIFTHSFVLFFMQYDVFISYSRKDTATADRIAAAFDRAGISYFIDRQGIGGGFEFPVVLAEAILSSRIVLFLGSKNSYESKFTNAELTFAFNEKQKNSILPYIIDGSTMPPALRFVFSSINWRTLESHPIEPALVEDVLHLLGRERRDGKAEAERRAREQAEQERVAREQAEAERRAKEQAARERKEREERAAREKAERERIAREKVEAERRAKEQAERERKEREERAAQEKAERECKEREEQQFRLNGRGRFGTFCVGDYYDDGQKEGVVFEVDSTGRHGKIVSLQETTAVWAADKNFGSWLRSDNPCKQWLGLKDREDGRRNLQRIMQLDNWEKRYPAFGVCVGMGTEWYLPAVDELKRLAESSVYDAVNFTLSEKRGRRLLAGREYWYWSSTESDDATSGYLCAQCVRMITSDVVDDFAYNSGYVRAVAAF